MGRPCFEVLTSGLQTTVQDLGRPGLLSTGMPPSGAFDAFSLRLSNIVVGNSPGDRFLVGRNPGAAGLEMLLMGPDLRTLRETVVAVGGADFAGRINDQPLPMWKAVRVEPDDILSFPTSRRGARSYLAVAGGIDVPLRLGSRATNVRARIGGVDGRPLRAGDVLSTLDAECCTSELIGRTLVAEARPPTQGPWELRVVLGPQDDLFLPESVELFLASDWELSATSDRMGCRFIGPQLSFKPRSSHLLDQAGANPSNIVDDTIPVGGIQVPGGVEPIAMGVDGPSLGGYAKIATVISSDLGRLAQVRPGETVRFVALSTADAVAVLRQTNAWVSEASIRR